ncbi:MAG: ATP-binding protein [Methanoregula sp.]|nr:MAG: ATP-binding protein [Methanoregula sp.]
MVWESVPVVLLLVLSGAMTSLFALVFWRTRASMKGAVPLVIILTAAAFWSWSAAAMYWSNTAFFLALGNIVENAAIAIIPVAFVQFSLQFTGKDSEGGTISRWLLLIIPLIMAALLIAAAVVPAVIPGLPTPFSLSLPYGSASIAVFWIYFTSWSLLIMAGFAFILQHYQSVYGVFRGQLACLLIAAFPPLFTHIGYMFQVYPFDIINLAPITGTISVVALSAGIDQFRLFDLSPIECGAALRQIPSGIVLLDAQGRVIEINPAALQILGDADRDIIGMGIHDILPAHELPPRYENGAASGHRQTLRREQAGAVHYIDLHCIPLTPARNVRHGYVILLSDITDQHLTDQSLAMARKKINFLTGITRHDILNQLTIIVMHNELLREAVGEPSLVKSLREQEKAASTISRQIAFTKDYEKLGENLPQWLDVKTIFSKHQEDLGHDYIIYSVQVEGLEVFGDPLVDRVFSNLLENSLRYGEKVTSIRLHYDQTPEGLTIIYEDNGTGIKKEEKEKIFRRGSGKRSGFGLFFSREILSLTGITMKETGEPGKGARFEILIPAGMFRFRSNNNGSGAPEVSRM